MRRHRFLSPTPEQVHPGLLLGPPFCFHREIRRRAKRSWEAVLVLTLATWFLPMIWASGTRRLFRSFCGSACCMRRPTLVDPKKEAFTIVWIAPALCFFTVIYLRVVNSGYLLLVLTPACIRRGSWASEWYENSGWRVSWMVTVIGLCGLRMFSSSFWVRSIAPTDRYGSSRLSSRAFVHRFLNLAARCHSYSRF
jgi:hypothetical protein